MMPAQGPGEHRPHLLLLVQREEADRAVDRLGRVEGVHRGEDQVAGLGRAERRLHGDQVADLPDHDHVRVLAQDAPQGAGERVGVEAHLALVDQRAAVHVEHLDRVLDRHHVLVGGPVDPVDHRGERGALARSRRAGDEDDPALLVGQAADGRRQLEVLDRQHLEGHHAQDDADRPALAEDVDAEAAEVVAGVREVGLAAASNSARLTSWPRRSSSAKRSVSSAAQHPVAGDLDQRAVDADDRARGHLEVQVAGAALDGVGEEGAELGRAAGEAGCGLRHAQCFGTRAGLHEPCRRRRPTTSVPKGRDRGTWGAGRRAGNVTVRVPDTPRPTARRIPPARLAILLGVWVVARRHGHCSWRTRSTSRWAPARATRPSPRSPARRSTRPRPTRPFRRWRSSWIAPCPDSRRT